MTGEKVQTYPAYVIKAGLMGAAVNAEQCEARGSKIYEDLSTILRNDENLLRNIGELRVPSSVIPTPEDIEELASTEAGMVRLELHAKELIRRAKEGDPYQPSGSVHNGGSRWQSGANPRTNKPPVFDVNARTRDRRRKNLIKGLRAGDVTPLNAYNAGSKAFSSVEDAAVFYDEGAAERGEPLWADVTAQSLPAGIESWIWN